MNQEYVEPLDSIEKKDHIRSHAQNLTKCFLLTYTILTKSPEYEKCEIYLYCELNKPPEQLDLTMASTELFLFWKYSLWIL